MSLLKLWCPNVFNLGDFFNCLPVVSGLAKSHGEQIHFVVPDCFQKIFGFREFMEFQPCIGKLVFRCEVLNMDEASYIVTTYTPNDFRHLTERPNRPTETMRHGDFINQNYYARTEDPPNWFVDDDFLFHVDDIAVPSTEGRYVVGDRWSKVTDTRRSWNILKDSGLFDDPEKFYFLDYETYSLMDNACIINNSEKPFLGTFTGSGMLADLLGKENYCLYDDSMLDPPWNGMPIEFSYWKHYYADRPNKLFHLNDPFLRTL